MGGGPRELTTYVDLLAAAEGDDFVRWMLDPRAPVRGWAFDGGAAFVRAGRRRSSLTVVSDASAAAAALPALVQRAPETDWATLPLGTLAQDVGDLVDAATGDDWEWMRTSEPPPQHPLAARVVDLDHHHDAAIAALLAVASPRASATTGSPHVLTWHGVADGRGGLLACGSHTETVPGVPHLASIATLPAARGQGLGEAVTSSLTRAALHAGRPVVTLGMYSDNEVARRLYRRLGFRCDHRWSSRRLCRAAPTHP